MQLEVVFFDENNPSEAPSNEVKRIWCDSNNPDNPFSSYIGNQAAVRRLSRAAFSAFGKYNRCCAGQNFALLGPASTGKTTLAKMFAKLVDLPFVEISPRSIKDVSDIAVEISKVCEEIVFENEDGTTSSLELMEDENGDFTVPPIIVFIDEVHSLRKNVVQALLKATEPNDNTLVCETSWVLDTKNVCWIIATTDRGQLFDAFDTRFTKIYLHLYSMEEMASIIHINNPDWNMDICRLVAKYSGGVPREALAFAREMRAEHEMNGGSWKEIASLVAEDNGIDEYGMTYQRVSILSALGQKSIPRNQMAMIAECKEEELTKYIMPSLLAKTSDRNPLVSISSKGYTITADGIKELVKRNIPYNKSLEKGMLI